MKILGLNFGHDAGVSLVIDGVFERHWEKERHVRVKHAMGLTTADIVTALAYMDTGLNEIDRVAVTSTQRVPIMFFDGSLDLRLKESGWPLDQVQGHTREGVYYRNAVQDSRPYSGTLAWTSAPPRKELLFMEPAIVNLPKHMMLEHLGRVRGAPDKTIREGCIGVGIDIDGTTFDGAYVSHHLCHAYYAYAESGVEPALVITMDGVASSTFEGGGIFLASGGVIKPIVPHSCWMGLFYNLASQRLGLGKMGGAGKLMGLAAWGKPAYARNGVGEWPALKTAHADGRWRINLGRLFEKWVEEPARVRQFVGLRDCDVPPPLEADLAASVQNMFEQTMLNLVETADRIARNAGFAYEAIVLGGGCALNCPANSLIYRRFNRPVVIPPAINDEGISAGAALALHALLDGQQGRFAKRGMGQIAYKGTPYIVTRADVEPYLGELAFVETDSAATYLAREIHQGAIVGIFDKGAEIGPRALGHRSLVGSPLIAENWPLLNRIKGREQWRPLAPIVLPEDADRYFDGFPPDSYYMLFNARVRTRALPAVTHVDGTARVQIAHPDNGFIFGLLQEFKSVSGCGVLVNTSLNGPDEPIVETPEHALRSFCRMKFDFLYLEGFVLRRR